MTELFVFTVALYMTFLYWHFSGRGHVLFTLQLHCVVLLTNVIFFVLFFYYYL